MYLVIYDTYLLIMISTIPQNYEGLVVLIDNYKDSCMYLTWREENVDVLYVNTSHAHGVCVCQLSMSCVVGERPVGTSGAHTFDLPVMRHDTASCGLPVLSQRICLCCTSTQVSQY